MRSHPLFSKIVVKGPGKAPLYQYLTDKKPDLKFSGDIDWNFANFLLNRKGEIVARYPAGEKPLTPDVLKAIEEQLKMPR